MSGIIKLFPSDINDIVAAESRKPQKHAFGWIYLTLAVGILFTWLAGMLKHGHLPETVCLVFLLWALCLGLFFVVTGLEMAFTDLRDKDPEQVRPGLKNLLADMQEHDTALYESKEWCAVLITVLLALMAEMHGEAHLRSLLPLNFSSELLRPILWLFASAFTTLPILWFAQMPAKRYALRNSEALLLKIGRPTWLMLRGVNWGIKNLRLSTPSELIVDLLGVPKERNLSVSLKTHYMMSLRRFGYANNLTEERIQIHANGNSTLELHYTTCVIRQPKKQFQFKGKIRTPLLGGLSSVLSCDVEIQSVYQMPLPREKYSELEEQLKGLGQPNHNWEKLKPDHFHKSAGPLPSAPEVYEFSIEPPFNQIKEGNALVIRYSVRYELQKINLLPKAGKPDEDFHVREFDWPTGQYRLRVGLDPAVPGTLAAPACDVSFGGTPHEVETDRSQKKAHVDDRDIVWNIDFPLAGAKYRITWQVWL